MARPSPLSRSAATFLVAGTLVLGLLVPSVADATIVEPLSLQALVERSDAVVLGTVVAQRSTFRQGIIWTTSTVEVEQCVIGECQRVAAVMVETPGGTVAGVSQRITGAAEVLRGEAYLFFLEEAVGPAYRPVALVQGVMAVEEQDDGARVAVEAVGDVAVLGPDGRLVGHERRHPQRLPLAGLLSTITELDTHP